MKFERLIILGMILMIGFVGASEQFYEFVIDIEHGDSNDTMGLNVIPHDEDNNGFVENPIKLFVDIEYEDAECNFYLFEDNSVIETVLIGSGGISGLQVKMNSEYNYEWEIECTDPDDNISEQSRSEEIDILDFRIEDIDELYINDKDISGEVFYQGDVDLELFHESSFIGIIDNNGGDFDIPENFLTEPGVYKLVAAIDNYFVNPVETYVEFVFATASVEFVDTQFEIGVSASIDLSVDAGSATGTYALGHGSSIIHSGIVDASLIDIDVSNFTPTSTGDYTLSLTLDIDDPISETGIIYSLNELTVTDSNDDDDDSDDEDPDVSIIAPKWDEIFYTSTIEFEYQAEDDVKLEFCELKLYNATISGGVPSWDNGDLIFPLNNNDRDLAKEEALSDFERIKFKLIDFDDRDYVVEVKCEDTSGNKGSDYNYFRVNLGGGGSGNGSSSTRTYDREAEVKGLIDKIDSFLEMYEDFGLDERNVVEILGIDLKMRNYDRKLNQIDQDLKHNLRYMEEAKRIKRIEEIDNEIDEIRADIVLSIDVTDTYEFSKSSIEIDMLNFLDKYFDLTGDNVKSGTMKLIARANEEIQRGLSVKAEAFKIDIEYLDETKQMVLVSKDLSLDSDLSGTILEILGDQVSEEVIFVSDANNVGEDIWEIDLSKDNRVVYYFFDDFSLQKIEKTESIIFSDTAGDDMGMITGFVVAIEDGLSFSFLGFFIGFLFLGYVGFLAAGKIKLNVWKNRDPSVSMMVDLIEATKRLLKENNLEKARSNYKEMGEVYKRLPSKTKNYFFNEIKIVRLAIDKKDVIGLVKEYEKARIEFRKDDAMDLHSKINSIYKKLPKKFQDKIYRRLVKGEVR